MSHPLPQRSHPIQEFESPPTDPTDRPSIEAPAPAHLSSTMSSRVSTRVSSSRTYIAVPRPDASYPPRLTPLSIPLADIAALGVADDLEKGLPRRPQPANQEEGLFSLRKTLVIVTALVPLLWVLSRLVANVHSSFNRLMINQFLATTDAVSQSLLPFGPLGIYPINYDRPRFYRSGLPCLMADSIAHP